LALACAAWWLRKVVAPFPSNQWDFKVYYFAAQAWRAGLNPYDPANLPPVAGADVYPFVYPPYMLGVFAAFTRISLEHALIVFLLLKLALLAGLIGLWSRLLRTHVTDPAWVLFLLFGYASCIYVDFASGNVTILEQALIWLGIAALFQERYWLFATLIVAASLFKLTPIALLALCAVIPGRARWRFALAGAMAFAVLMVATYLASHELTAEFIRSAASLDERGRVNPSALAFIRDSAELLAHASGRSLPAVLTLTAYAVLVVAVVAATWFGAARLMASEVSNRVQAVAFLILLAFAVVQPRFKNYSYILAVVPTFYIATHSTRLRRAAPLLLLACIPAYSWITSVENLTLIANYTSWFTVLGAWALCLYEMRRGTLLSPALP